MVQQAGTITLDTPVQFLAGVGPMRAQAFDELGVKTVGDLLEYYPRDWVFMPEPMAISDVRANQTVCILGLVEQTDWQPYRKIPLFEATLADQTGTIRIVWFHGRYLVNQLEPGQMLLVHGKAIRYRYQLQINNPKFLIVHPDQPRGPDAFSGPVYPASAKLPSWQIKKIVRTNIDLLAPLMPELFDAAFRKRNELMPRPDAYRQIHIPDNEDMLAAARRRLKYEELFFMQAGLALKRYHIQHACPAVPMVCTDEIDRRIRQRFPFLLTADQEQVIREITADMAKEVPMNRLLQGDVGSGKTVVALYAALVAVANKTQAAIMAPTEILARQHFASIERFLAGSRVRRELLIGGLTGKNRQELLNRVKNGDVDIVVGTVALLEEDVAFANLGLVIIDEQHKFGVHQRAGLRKGHWPHCLVMTATPIPRTLAMTAFGDLDVSMIKHTPPGRGEVITRWVQPPNRRDAMEFIRQRLRAKKQAYFVYPRIDAFSEADSANGDIKAAVDEYHYLKEKIFPEFKIGLLHGQMPSAEKEQVMEQFRTGKLDVLVSTVVIEVGVDVPNATIMVIENANRFGLAQLHQLRGRIGRGQSKSYCLLFAETDDEKAVSRLQILTRSRDGFEIAEQDLRLRGPGELFSARQHGLPDLKIANIVDDFDLLNLARRDAFELIEADPALTSPHNAAVRQELIRRFGAKLGLADIG
ncbi:MAG TPA: ATP-dependent DNA helicase RecG [Anaerohalosphaeraceae bacterium]|nr:ATP-dependent DNA helicase RecG [Anaerohalosphaeraceae bacterium]